MGATQSTPVACPPAPTCPAPVACPPAPTMLGFNYKSVNPSTDAFLQKTQKVMIQFQKVGCNEMVPKIIYNIKKEKPSGSPQSAEQIKQKFIDSMPNTDPSRGGLSDNSLFLLRNSIVELFNTFVDNATVNGITDIRKANQDMVDALSSLCPGEMMGKYTVDVQITAAQEKQFKENYLNLAASLNNDDDRKTVRNLLMKAPHNKTGGGKLSVSKLDEMTTYIWNNSNGLRVDLKTKVQKWVNDNRAVVNLPQLSSATTKSTFGSMSHFGSGSCLFLLFLIIVVGVLYYLHSKGKLKFPTMGQRIAQFGRDMKSIRGIRARR